MADVKVEAGPKLVCKMKIIRADGTIEYREQKMKLTDRMRRLLQDLKQRSKQNG